MRIWDGKHHKLKVIGFLHAFIVHVLYARMCGTGKASQARYFYFDK